MSARRSFSPCGSDPDRLAPSEGRMASFADEVKGASSGPTASPPAETVQSQGPLIADDRALQSRQNQQADNRGHNQPKGSDGEKWHLRRSVVRQENPEAADETGDEQRQKGRRVIGAVTAQVLAAGRTARIDAEIGAEHRAPAAIGTAPDEAAPDRDGDIAILEVIDGFRASGTWRRRKPRVSRARRINHGFLLVGGEKLARLVPTRRTNGIVSFG
jgi:hypothetical protein